jgi:prevent-host-death family protein
VSVRYLRNHGANVLGRVERGEVLIVTRDGRPVAELRPLPKPSLIAEELLKSSVNFTRSRVGRRAGEKHRPTPDDAPAPPLLVVAG